MTECNNISKESTRGCGQRINVQEETREGRLMETDERREKGDAIIGENGAKQCSQKHSQERGLYQ